MHRPFSAVVTTGIYCRPGCGGRPDPRNVQRYPSAAAAEADGFRACLRCRPYRDSDHLAPVGSELVCRAIHLIVAGSLDGGGEAELAARIGVSARHLRRRFVAELGVTPDGLARSRRAHFARRLLDDTDLAIAEVAFAAGFGSVRQFNRVCREVFQATPGSLRARRRRTDRLAPPQDGLALRLPVQEPFDWEALLRFLAGRAIPGVESVAARSYRRTITVDGQAGIVELEKADGGPLVLRVYLQRWNQLIHVVARARRLVGADAPVDEPNSALATDPVASPLMAAMPGIRPPGAWDSFEVGVRAILGQQVSVRGASTLAGRLAAVFGDPLPGTRGAGLSRTFPTAPRLADADLRQVGLTKARAEAIRTFAGAVAAGQLRLDRSVGLDHLVSELCSLPGVGPWTAHYIALRCGEPDAFPVSDLGLRRALTTREPLRVDELEQLASGWRPWRASVAVRLWLAAPTAPALAEARAAVTPHARDRASNGSRTDAPVPRGEMRAPLQDVSSVPPAPPEVPGAR